jgi:hypothetical protein
MGLSTSKKTEQFKLTDHLEDYGVTGLLEELRLLCEANAKSENKSVAAEWAKCGEIVTQAVMRIDNEIGTWF